MASFKKKWSDNVPGAYFVDDQCIDCDACRSESPSHFTRNEEQGYSYVYQQPSSPEESASCQSALESCPVDAIGVVPPSESSLS